ncbi:Transcription factor AP-1, partial [Stegodyphus mimosarum]
MEMTFYDDSQFRFGKNDGKSLKRPATLDLDSGAATKKQKVNALLTSPDLNMLKLGSPELERFIIANLANGNLSTPTPSQVLFPKNVTAEQEQYARGFLDALNELHHNQKTSLEQNTDLLTSENNSGTLAKLYPGVVPFYFQPMTTASVIKSSGKSVLQTTAPIIRPPSVDNTSSNSCNSNSLPVPIDIAIKEELQTVPNDFSSPPVSPLCNAPIDMADQERIKLERKRHRNRIAASKCRKRKLEKISQLEQKVKELKGENSKLEAVADSLREQVCNLKQQVMEHVKKGCQIMVAHGL